MLRRIANGVLVFVLLLTTTGITYHYHYCGNTLMSFSMLHTPKPCCEHPEDCCRDRATTFQLKNDYLFTAEQADFHIVIADLPAITEPIIIVKPVAGTCRHHADESPPPTVSLRLSRLQQYLI